MRGRYLRMRPFVEVAKRTRRGVAARSRAAASLAPSPQPSPRRGEGARGYRKPRIPRPALFASRLSPAQRVQEVRAGSAPLFGAPMARRAGGGPARRVAGRMPASFSSGRDAPSKNPAVRPRTFRAGGPEGAPSGCPFSWLLLFTSGILPSALRVGFAVRPRSRRGRGQAKRSSPAAGRRAEPRRRRTRPSQCQEKRIRRAPGDNRAASPWAPAPDRVRGRLCAGATRTGG